MKKVILIFVVLLSHALVFAQETAKYRITYDCDMPNGVGVASTFRWVLDIGENSAVFYNHSYRAYMDELDEIRKTADAMSMIAQIPQLAQKYPGRSSLQVAIGIPKSGMYTYYSSVQSTPLKYEEPLPVIEWQMTDSVRTFCEYPCKQAVGSVYGRTWTVWYAPELPLDYGPYILHGLPGMILSAKDSEGVYDFYAVGIEMAPENTRLTVYKESEAKKCSRKQFLKMRTDTEGMTIRQKLKSAGVAIIEVRDKDGKDITNTVTPKKNHLDKE